MLQHLDILIAFATVILGVSLLVTVMTQMVAAFLGLRGTHLEWGIKTLLSEVSPALRPQAAELTRQVLHHPLISDSTASRIGAGKTPKSDKWLDRLIEWLHQIGWGWLAACLQLVNLRKFSLIHRWKLANAIRCAELTDVLAKLASAPTPAGQAPPPWQTALQNADQTQVKSEIEKWFEPIMDRVSQRFALNSRVFTVVLAAGLAFALHLDTFQLLQRLSTDGELRRSLVEQAGAMANMASNTLARVAVTTPSEDSPQTVVSNQLAEVQRLATTLTNRFGAAGLQLLPDYRQHTRNCFRPRSEPGGWPHLFGILATVALLSLGAPFWFNALKTFVNLRPILATKVKKEMEEAKVPK